MKNKISEEQLKTLNTNTTKEEIRKIIDEMHIKNAGEIDEIQTFMIKMGIEVIIEPITNTINKLFDKGEFT